MSAPTAGIIGLNQKPKAGAAGKGCQKERTNAVMPITEFYDDDLKGFRTRTFASRLLYVLNPQELPPVWPKTEFSPC
jgi:hypothetical protein